MLARGLGSRFVSLAVIREMLYTATHMNPINPHTSTSLVEAALVVSVLPYRFSLDSTDRTGSDVVLTGRRAR